jgi:hypothetical protein
MKLLVTQGSSRSLLSRSTCGYLACSRRKCQKFARNDPQGKPANLHPTVVPGNERESSPDRFPLRASLIPPAAIFFPGPIRLRLRIICSGGSDPQPESDPVPERQPSSVLLRLPLADRGRSTASFRRENGSGECSNAITIVNGLMGSEVDCGVRTQGDSDSWQAVFCREDLHGGLAPAHALQL